MKEKALNLEQWKLRAGRNVSWSGRMAMKHGEKCIFCLKSSQVLLQLMGSAESSYQQRFHQRYAFVQPLNDPNYGSLKVYRKKELNFDYVALLQRPLQKQHLQQALRELEAVRRSFAEERSPMLLRVFHAEEYQGSQCGGQGLRVYMEYLTFTLRDEIIQRAASSLAFSLQEQAYVLHSAIDTYQQLLTLGISQPPLRADTVFISVQGFLRFSPIRVIDFQEQTEGECDCLPRPVVQHYFQKSQRQFLIEIKNLLHEMVAICPRTSVYFQGSYQLLAAANHCRTLSNLIPLLPPATLQALPSKKLPESTEISTIRDPSTSLHHSSARSKRSLRQNPYPHYP